MNPEIKGNVCALSEDGYVAYSGLRKLSRRSRYLVNENDVRNPAASRSYEKHFHKALHHLDTLLVELGKVVGKQNFPSTIIYCNGEPHKHNEHTFFTIVTKKPVE